MCLKKKQAFISILSWSIRVQNWESFILILSRILCYILVVFEQDIVFGAYLTLQAESREDVDVFKKKQAFISILSWKKEKHICVHMILMLLWNTNNKMAAPAPVQLQWPVTVSGLVFCVFVYGQDQQGIPMAKRIKTSGTRKTLGDTIQNSKRLIINILEQIISLWWLGSKTAALDFEKWTV